jgi:uncharacterized protein (TIGR04222 family)
MQWLFENPLANMPGPAFLGLFGALLVGAVVILRIMAARIEEGEDSRPLPIPSDIDPYQIAFLRGGDAEVIRTALVDLVEQGRIVRVEKTWMGKILANSQIQWKVADATDTGADLSPIQRTLLQAFTIPRDPESMFQPDIRSKVHEHTKPLRDWVAQENLEVDPEGRSQMTKLLIVCLVGLGGLGLYKLAAAYMNQRTNVIFLIGMMLFGVIILFACGRHRKLTLRGQRFLRDLQTAFGSIQSLKVAQQNPANTPYGIGNASMPLMAMGIFGVTALQGSDYDPIYQSYQKSAATGSGCSSFSYSSCGSSGDSDSGSGSGCGSGSGSGSGSGCGGCGGGGCGGGD